MIRFDIEIREIQSEEYPGESYLQATIFDRSVEPHQQKLVVSPRFPSDCDSQDKMPAFRFISDMTHIQIQEQVLRKP